MEPISLDGVLAEDFDNCVLDKARASPGVMVVNRRGNTFEVVKKLLQLLFESVKRVINFGK